MSAILPLLGGLLLGMFATRRIAIIGQAVLVALSAALLIESAPDHGGSYVSGIGLAAAMAVVSAGSLLLGFWLRGRRLHAT